MHIFPFSREELNFFKQLNKNRQPYIIVGLSAAALQGAPIVTKDVDIWFKDLSDPKLQALFKKCKITYIPSFGQNPPVLTGKGIELLDIVTHVHGVKGFDVEYKKCLTIKAAGVSLKVLPLEDIIKSKKSLNRTKDVLVLPVLEDTLTTRKEKRNL